VNGAKEAIRFVIGASSLGATLIASSNSGVVAILLDDDPETLIRQLQERFPKARLVGANEDDHDVVVRIVGFVEEPAVGLDLPLDMRGTVFQRRVWQALRDIPIGQTVSYADVAGVGA
jgi:AraC family transcriptional regulator of adaptative response/methylated-DNA-[protein]-cysteine methyltransferase